MEDDLKVDGPSVTSCDISREQVNVSVTSEEEQTCSLTEGLRVDHRESENTSLILCDRLSDLQLFSFGRPHYRALSSTRLDRNSHWDSTSLTTARELVTTRSLWETPRISIECPGVVTSFPPPLGDVSFRQERDSAHFHQLQKSRCRRGDEEVRVEERRRGGKGGGEETRSGDEQEVEEATLEVGGQRSQHRHNDGMMKECRTVFLSIPSSFKNLRPQQFERYRPRVSDSSTASPERTKTHRDEWTEQRYAT
ncbi:unnamed protein product [Pleuronectes platessa]|uniref:Uncharacterized protein n=1 Tax=Pleuronectes platessa TaxID=8262 RepID=A0A9N7VSB5_PLEPL|nr:unnamed protein product [Pleuronectes platessa]